jgi:hypothetical protein
MRTFICAAHTGGQGKTTVSQAIHRALWQRGEGQHYKLVSADFCDDFGRSKLGKFQPGMVTELGIGALLTSAKQENDSNAALKYWDRFGQVLLEGGAVIDVGANVITMLKQWAQHRNAHRILAAKNAAPIEIMLVCKAEKHAVQDVAELVKSIGDGKFVPYSGITVVQNEVGGNFDKIDVRRIIGQTAPKIHVDYVTLPRCTSELWARLEQTYTSVEKALAMREEEIARHLDIDIWSASAGLADLKTWVAAVDAELSRHLREPQAAPAKLIDVAYPEPLHKDGAGGGLPEGSLAAAS